MKISELLEKLGEIQGEHGDVDVYLGDRFREDAVLEEADIVQTVDHYPEGWINNKPCVIIFNY